MTTQQSNQRGSRPAPSKPPSRAARASYPTSGYPRLRAAIWVAALLCGGLLLVLLFFSTIGVVDFFDAPVLGVVAIGMAVFFGVTMWTYSRSARRGNSRWADRERRGF